MSFFTSTGLNASDVSLRCLGGIAPSIVNAVYPMEKLTQFHYARHIPGITGRWMDTGSTALKGTVGGSFHRMTGHHIFEDGAKVLITPDLKFGEFIHHLGLDFLTQRGIPNPLFPKFIGEQLLKTGLSKQFVYEFTTINASKILSGSLGVVCAGQDILLCFSDAIPHTFLNASAHFGTGVLELLFGTYPPNILLLTAGSMEVGVGLTTAYKAFVDPILPAVGVPSSIYFPALKQAVAMGAVIGACASIFTGDSWIDVPKTIFASASASAASTSVSFMAATKGFLAPFLGPTSAIITYLVVKKILDSFWQTNENETFVYEEFIDKEDLSVFNTNMTIPMMGIPNAPIGRLQNGKILLDENAIRQQATFWNL